MGLNCLFYYERKTPLIEQLTGGERLTMTEDLQHLLNKIRTEAVDEAEQQAADLIGQAEQKAAVIVQEARKQAEQHMKDAEQDAARFETRSQESIRQAARDVLISLRQEIDKELGALVKSMVNAALEPAPLTDLLGKAVEAYLASTTQDSLEVVLSPADHKTLADTFMKSFGDKVKGGLILGADAGILKGFHISASGEEGYHDFSNEALADALSSFLRPHLAEVVKRAAQPESAENPAE